MRDAVGVEEISVGGAPLHLIQKDLSEYWHNARLFKLGRLTPVLWPGTTTLPDSVLTSASSFNALPLLTAVAVAPCFLLLACAAAAICLSRTVDASDLVSSCAVRFAGGILFETRAEDQSSLGSWGEESM